MQWLIHNLPQQLLFSLLCALPLLLPTVMPTTQHLGKRTITLINYTSDDAPLAKPYVHMIRPLR